MKRVHCEEPRQPVLWLTGQGRRASSPPAPVPRFGAILQDPWAVVHTVRRGWPVRGLQERPNRPRRLSDIGEQLGERVAHRQGLAAPFLGGQHIVDERAAMQNALLLAPEGVELGERWGRRARRRGDGRGGRRVTARARKRSSATTTKLHGGEV